MPFFDNSKSSHGRQTAPTPKAKNKLQVLDTEDARSSHDVSSVAGDDDHDDNMSDHMGTGGESSASDGFPSSSGSSGPKKPPEIAAKEAKWVFLSKLLVVAVLVGSAAAASIVAYKFTSAQDEAEFEDQFHDYADELMEVSGNTAYSTFSVLESFSKTVTSLAEFAQVEWPLLTIPHFEVRGSEYLRSSGAQLVSFAPVVKPDKRDLWEPYSVEHQDWIQQGIDFVLDVGSDDHNFLDRANDNAMIEAAPIREEIWRAALRSSQSIRDYTEGPWVPLWQTYPPPQDSFIVNFNLMTHPSFEKLLKKCIETRKAVLSEVLDNTVLFGNAKTNDVNPKSVVVEPIFSDFGRDADIVAFMVVIVPWDVYFQNVIFEGSHPITAVLRNDCGDAFTYQVDGPRAAFLGVGDLHDTTFDEFEMSTSFAKYVQRSVGGNATAAPHKHQVGLESYCEYSLHVYPTQQMKDAFSSNMPVLITVGVICVFCFVSLIFVLYDTLVTARQRKVANQASRTTAIVASLFPSEVHDRLFGAAEDDNKKKKGKLASHAPKFHLMNFLSDEENALQNKDNNKNNKGQMIPFSSSKPIADLFPEATVMFADISGFTAWSSVREPSQVFILLETIYNAFDRIAKKRKVFKVETIGDTYLAVCGLPSPRKDHAVVMARFAYDCCVEMRRLCNNLEVELGPDTSDLAMRFGLHSGAVTAGVLRGEKTRFQLFGDTVNTASRMETTSERNKIQASFDTAALLREAGKGKWLTPRDKLIFAKGKGEMQTYFVHPKSSTSLSHSSSASGEHASTSSMKDESKESHNGEIRTDSTGKLRDAKLQRSADWICEILLRLLKQMVARRMASGRPTTGGSKELRQAALAMQPEAGKMVLDEAEEVIYLPKFDAKAAKKYVAPESVVLPEKVQAQLHDLVGVIASLYRDNPFHNFHHAAHVTMSVSKLLSRIVAPDLLGKEKELESKLHDHTYGITSDPLTQFAVVFSAMIHDVDHSGLPNATLVRDKTDLAEYYKNKSVAEQNSVDISWSILMDPSYKDLCECIFTNRDELYRFRQLVVNAVLATDIADKELGAARKERWAKAFAPENCAAQNKELTEMDVVNRKATIVIEHIIQASDVSHTMQHWQIFVRWNEKLFAEMHRAYRHGLSDKHPAEFWYQGELGFFDFYIIPLAKKLKECGVFGVSSTEYLNYAVQNRSEWEKKGKDIVQGFMDKYDKSADA